MGVYIYRVTAQLVKLADGRKAHVAQFAYKPWGWGDRNNERVNQRLHFITGCVASANMTLKSDLIATVDPKEENGTGSLYQNPNGLKVFYDDTTLGTDKMPFVGSLKRNGKVYAIQGETR